MKKGIVTISALLAAGMLSGCGPQESGGAFLEGRSDLAYVQGKGTLVVGVTDFAPMDYREDGAWTGFDAQMAESFAQSIGVTAVFEEIDWDKKAELLQEGEIDCIWNGMTLTGQLQEEIDCSDAYLTNAQVMVLRKENLEQYQTAEECQHLLFAVETGSAGEDLLRDLNYRYTEYHTQKEALQSLLDKKADAAVADLTMAGYCTKSGNGLDGLGFHILLNQEKLCVGLRKGSDLTELLNAFLKESMQNGTLGDVAAQYGLEDALIR